jgi:hypothetical protein
MFSLVNGSEPQKQQDKNSVEKCELVIWFWSDDNLS